MKTNNLPIKAFLAALGAILFVPVSAVAAAFAFAFTVTGVFALLLADYGRTLEPLRAEAALVPFAAAPCKLHELPTAA